MMKKTILALAMSVTLFGLVSTSEAQQNKNKKSRYYQNSENDPGFDVKGFFTNEDKNEVEKKPVETEYDVKIDRNETDDKYRGERRVRTSETDEERELAREERRKRRLEKQKQSGYHTTYGGYRGYDENREKYDKYYNGSQATPPSYEEQAPAPRTAIKKAKPAKEREIKMTSNEVEYKTTVVKRRYTNLDVLCDDLDLAKVQRPVFKGICSECASDVDLIITNKNLSSLEKNYQLKQCYMLRDKRLRDTLDDDQYRKFLRIKDADEYLILTKDPELKDGIYN
jgi:hypothetical protein